ENGTYIIKTKATVKDGLTGNASEKPNPHASDPFTVFVCDNGTHAEGNSCVPNKRTCTIANGTGEQTWNSTTKTWGTCEVKACNAGYTKVGNVCKKDENQFQCPTNLPRLNVTLPTDKATRSAWVEKIKGLKFIKMSSELDPVSKEAGTYETNEHVGYTEIFRYRRILPGIFPDDSQETFTAEITSGHRRVEQIERETVAWWNNLVCQWQALVPELEKCPTGTHKSGNSCVPNI
ncbi:MAG: hypothetical protein Q4A35_04430, partial [Candidatus Gracilibacteria bacterium]|nr:hypothetical protein [Candidatus Gracilibacteria bacterium]